VAIETEDGVATADPFDAFVGTVRTRLAPALIAGLGPERGREALAEALGYAWEHRDRVMAMEFPAAYLFRVGQSRSRWVTRRRPPVFPPPAELGLADIEPALVTVLARLTEQQRTCVVLVHAYQWTHAEVAELLGIKRSCVQNHVERAMTRLRSGLGVEP
jgi:RNA polymerase sigma-70 factor (ECF subfamily)